MPTAAPTYLVRNSYSYCFRMNVPSDLQSCIGKKELRYSLQTGCLSDAKFKARFNAAGVKMLFRKVRELRTMKLIDKQIQEVAIGHLKQLKTAFDAPKPMFEGIPMEGTTRKTLTGSVESDSFIAALGLQKQLEAFAIDKVQIMIDLEIGNDGPMIKEMPDLLEEHGMDFDDVDQNDPSFWQNKRKR